ncbi:MAG: ferrous iron transport protein A [Fimbriimonadaceae bacterium]|nr:ferrous iron transport protein A [Fimbriimonadaceae bacterium]
MIDVLDRVAVLGLDRAPAGGWVRVVELREQAAENDCRLREMGLYEGARLLVQSTGDPVVVALLGTRLAVCGRCAQHVQVSLAAAGD